MATWQLQQAKQRFSELVRTTLDEGPQIVTRNGEEVVVVVRAAEWRAAQRPSKDFLTVLREGPSFEDLDLRRQSDPPREIDL